jgi:hypothetical protein
MISATPAALSDCCRKHSGTAVCTQTRVQREQFRFLQGEELIKVYGKGEGAVKAFCIAVQSFGGVTRRFPMPKPKPDITRPVVNLRGTFITSTSKTQRRIKQVPDIPQ